jgi:DNA-binding NtrC family response regulator
MMNDHYFEAENIHVLARLDFLDVCILGETGTGKTHLARLIHDSSPRAAKPFIAVNCAELAPSLIEAEFFGCEKGAFTGAAGAKEGKFEAADGGTLFLDEIGELPAGLQAKLLKVVEEKSVTRVGGNRPRSVDVRIIYATHRALEVLREDLRYRVAAAHAIHLKPLRERKCEIMPLARAFLAEFGRRSGRRFSAGKETLKLLETGEWRGNVRELRSFVEKACLDAIFAAEREKSKSEAIELTKKSFAPRLSPAARGKTSELHSYAANLPHFAPGEKMEEYLERIETQLLQAAMQANGNNRTRAARSLGLSRTGLIKKLKRLDH